jgi:hypothetical protein
VDDAVVGVQPLGDPAMPGTGTAPGGVAVPAAAAAGTGAIVAGVVSWGTVRGARVDSVANGGMVQVDDAAVEAVVVNAVESAARS